MMKSALSLSLVAFGTALLAGCHSTGPLASSGVQAAPAPVASHWGDKPRTRQIVGSTIVSQAHPAARIHVPESARYLGSTRFDLKGVADAEIHLFAETDGAGVVQRAYWIQFESYLPQLPAAHYDFSDSGLPLARLGEMELYYRARFGRAADAPPDGSEAQRVRAMLHRAGYRLPAETYSAQFHQVVSEDKRSEILVIMIGDLAALDLSFDQIVAGGRGGQPYQALSERVLPKAQAAIAIEVDPQGP